MIQHCVNPACGKEFKLFNTGKLYAHERRAANTEFFWLCSTCAPQFDLRLDQRRNSEVSVALIPRGASGRARPPHLDGSLRLVAQPAQAPPRMPWHQSTPAGETPAASSSGFPLGPFCSICEAA
jgi:hypothetical protein